MDYNQPLIEGQFLKRYKRFFADVQLGGEIVVAHVPNTGSLKGICDQPRPCRVLKNDDPTRKLKYTLEQVKTDTSWVGVNTHRANEIVWEAFQRKMIPHWAEYQDGSREVKISAETRLDMKLTSSQKPEHFVEVKSVTLAEGECALFPDAVTTRGQKHIRELIELQKAGHTTELFFLVQRTDCVTFAAAQNIDPEYAELLTKAHSAGVKISIYPAILMNNRIELNAEKNLKLLLSR